MFILSSHTAPLRSQAEACVARLLECIRNQSGRFFRGSANTLLVDSETRIATWKHKDAAESDHYNDGKTFAGWIHFKDGSTAWWRLDRPNELQQPSFGARIANYPTRSELRLLSYTSGKVIADFARRCSAAKAPIATSDGKLKGVCRALVMNAFSQLQLHWPQFGAKIFEYKRGSSGAEHAGQYFANDVVRPGE